LTTFAILMAITLASLDEYTVMTAFDFL